ncbi:unnamed protein product [Boreogadus saida]
MACHGALHKDNEHISCGNHANNTHHHATQTKQADSYTAAAAAAAKKPASNRERESTRGLRARTATEREHVAVSAAHRAAASFPGAQAVLRSIRSALRWGPWGGAVPGQQMGL